MKSKTTLIIVAIIIAIAGGAAYLAATGGTMPATETTNRTAPAADAPQTTPGDSPDTPVSNQAGTYADYREGAIAATSGTKLLFFHAPWCPQCRALDADIKQQGVPAGVTIFKVDYDSNQALRQKYGVTIQTTVVRVDDAGNLVEKVNPYQDPTLDTVTKALL